MGRVKTDTRLARELREAEIVNRQAEAAEHAVNAAAGAVVPAAEVGIAAWTVIQLSRRLELGSLQMREIEIKLGPVVIGKYEMGVGLGIKELVGLWVVSDLLALATPRAMEVQGDTIWRTWGAENHVQPRSRLPDILTTFASPSGFFNPVISESLSEHGEPLVSLDGVTLTPWVIGLYTAVISLGTVGLVEAVKAAAAALGGKLGGG